MDAALYKSLDDWRHDTTVRVYGEGNLRDYGTALVLPTPILERILVCAHYGKIKTADDLKREASWGQATQYGSEVVAIINQVYPPHDNTSNDARSSQQVMDRAPLGENPRIVNAASEAAEPAIVSCRSDLYNKLLSYPSCRMSSRLPRSTVTPSGFLLRRRACCLNCKSSERRPTS